MELQALNDRVMVRVSPAEAAVGGAGIIVARESRPDQHIGEVVASGPQAQEVQPGDRVVFRDYGPRMPYETAIVGEEQLLVLRGKDVLAVVEA